MDSLKIKALWILVISSFLAISGCAKVAIRTISDEYGEPVMVVESSGYGRTCLAIDLAPDGSVSVIVAQDGTSDFSITRMFAFIGEIVGQMPLIGANTNPDDMQGPSDISSCGQVFEDSIDAAIGPVSTEEE